MAEEQKKPLSETPTGYILAAIGGILGGPIGLFASPCILYLLNHTLSPKNGKQPNRFLVWVFIGIIGAPLAWVPLQGGQDVTRESRNPEPLPEEQNSPDETSFNPSIESPCYPYKGLKPPPYCYRWIGDREGLTNETILIHPLGQTSVMALTPVGSAKGQWVGRGNAELETGSGLSIYCNGVAKTALILGKSIGEGICSLE